MGEDGRGWERTGCKASGGRHVVVPPAGEWFDMVLSFPFYKLSVSFKVTYVQKKLQQDYLYQACLS